MKARSSSFAEVVENGAAEMAEVDWSVETVASRVTVPKAELPTSETRAKPSRSKSAFNFLAKTRFGLMAYLMGCFSRVIALGHTRNLSPYGQQCCLRRIPAPLKHTYGKNAYNAPGENLRNIISERE